MHDETYNPLSIAIHFYFNSLIRETNKILIFHSTQMMTIFLRLLINLHNNFWSAAGSTPSVLVHIKVFPGRGARDYFFSTLVSALSSFTNFCLIFQPSLTASHKQLCWFWHNSTLLFSNDTSRYFFLFYILVARSWPSLFPNFTRTILARQY